MKTYTNLEVSTGMMLGKKPVVIVIRADRLSKIDPICFRGRDKPLAGNLWRFQNILEVFHRGELAPRKIAERAVQMLEARQKVGSVAIDYREFVGWASNDVLGKYSPEDLDRCHPNRRTSAWRVKPDRLHIKAPFTSVLTAVFHVQVEEWRISVVIDFMYPGKDTGKLHGDISASRGIVLFDWRHPGEPLPTTRSK